MLFLLIAGHALGDYPLQSEAMATCKCRKAHLPLQNEVPWYYWMTAHCLVHGLITALLIHWCGWSMQLAVIYGVFEFAAHWIIDSLKCEGVTSIHIDQLLHVACKIAWWAMIVNHVIVV